MSGLDILERMSETSGKLLRLAGRLNTLHYEAFPAGFVADAQKRDICDEVESVATHGGGLTEMV